jgi:hypothetical protein
LDRDEGACPIGVAVFRQRVRGWVSIGVEVRLFVIGARSIGSTPVQAKRSAICVSDPLPGIGTNAALLGSPCGGLGQ